jgi:LuxR family transcriptional regulator, activator of tox operons
MEVQDITQRHATKASPLIRLDQLIGAAGMPIFPDLLFRELRGLTGCAHLSALLFTSGWPIQIILATNEGPLALAKRTAQKYVVEYWKHDPANSLAGNAQTVELSARFAPNEINEKNYRRECYNNLDLVDRFSILQKRNRTTTRLNLYRSKSSGRFSDNQIATIVDASSVLFALITKHHDLGQHQEPATEAARRRLLLAEPKLSTRELDVCVGIVCGQTSEAIALSLGLSVNTVLTYRKRAYSRLGISTQNELMRLLMMC